MKLIYNTVKQQINAVVEQLPEELIECNRGCDGNPRIDFRCLQPQTTCQYRIALDIPEGLDFYKVEDNLVVEDLAAKQQDKEAKKEAKESATRELIKEAKKQMEDDIAAEKERIFELKNEDFKAYKEAKKAEFEAYKESLKGDK